MTDFHPGQVVYHSSFGTGRIANIEEEKIAVNFIKGGVKVFTTKEAETWLSDAPPVEEADVQDADELKESLRTVLREEGLCGTVPIAEKWEGGEVVLRPGKPGLQEKSVPIDTLFHKIVMIRNQLRLLEQNVNASQLSDREKVDIQQYITRCYGSLTTFNVLFAEKNDWFVGSKKE